MRRETAAMMPRPRGGPRGREAGPGAERAARTGTRTAPPRAAAAARQPPRRASITAKPGTPSRGWRPSSAIANPASASQAR